MFEMGAGYVWCHWGQTSCWSTGRSKIAFHNHINWRAVVDIVLEWVNCKLIRYVLRHALKKKKIENNGRYPFSGIKIARKFCHEIMSLRAFVIVHIILDCDCASSVCPRTYMMVSMLTISELLLDVLNLTFSYCSSLISYTNRCHTSGTYCSTFNLLL